MSNTYNDLPPYSARKLQRLHEEMFGDLLAAITRVIGPIEDDQAEKVVGAILGPLRLVPPPPEDYASLCGRSYFSEEGEWHFCDKRHDDPNACGDPHVHRSLAGEEWYDDQDDPRSFEPPREGIT